MAILRKNGNPRVNYVRQDQIERHGERLDFDPMAIAWGNVKPQPAKPTKRKPAKGAENGRQ